MIEEMDIAFDKFTQDMSKTFGEIKNVLLETNRIMRDDINKINRTMVETSMQITKPSASTSFIKETFGSEFNKPALWSRDIVALSGMKEYMDMTRSQSEYYARKHWQQRADLIMPELSSFAAYGAGSLFGLPGMAAAVGYDMAIKPMIEDRIVRRHNWWNALDRYGKKNILAGDSSNLITNTGWSDVQLDELSKFMGSSYRGTGFKKEISDDLVMMAESGGYFKDVATVSQYKTKYKELLKGVKEIMQTLHTSHEEAVSMMSGISNMRISKPLDYIKQMNTAAAYTGLSTEQLISWSSNMSKDLYSNYGIKEEWGANMALEMIKNKDMTPIQQKGLSSILQNPVYLTALSTYKEGKWAIDPDKINKYISGEINDIDLRKLATESLKGGNFEEKILAYEANKGNLVSQMDTFQGGALAKSIALNEAKTIVSRLYPEYTGEKRTNAVRTILANTGKYNAAEINTIMEFEKSPLTGINYNLEAGKYAKEPYRYDFLKESIVDPLADEFQQIYDFINYDIGKAGSTVELRRRKLSKLSETDIWGAIKNIAERTGDENIMREAVLTPFEVENIHSIRKSWEKAGREEDVGIIDEELDRLIYNQEFYELNKETIEEATGSKSVPFLGRLFKVFTNLTGSNKSIFDIIDDQAIISGALNEKGWVTGFGPNVYTRRDVTKEQMIEEYKNVSDFMKYVITDEKEYPELVEEMIDKGYMADVFAEIKDAKNKNKNYDMALTLRKMSGKLGPNYDLEGLAKEFGVSIDEIRGAIASGVRQHAESEGVDVSYTIPEYQEPVDQYQASTYEQIVKYAKTKTQYDEEIEEDIYGSKTMKRYLAFGGDEKKFFKELEGEYPEYVREHKQKIKKMITTMDSMAEEDNAIKAAARADLDIDKKRVENIQSRASGMFSGQDYETLMVVINNLLLASENINKASEITLKKAGE
jgi:hypothetical protein